MSKNIQTEGNIKKFKKNKGHESISRNMLQDEDNLSIGAIGLLSNLLSYPDSWQLHKTELYKRFKKSKRAKIETAWDELVEEKYIVQFKKRNGKRYEYVYYFQEERFTDEDLKEVCEIEQSELWDGKATKPDSSKDSWTVDFQQSNLNSPKSADKRSIIKEVYHEDKEDTKIDTYKDTEKADFPSKQTEKDKLYKESLKRNIPPATFRNLSILSENYDEMYKWFGIVLRAKKKVEENRGELLLLENIDQELNRILVAGIRKIKKDTTITNKDNYLFTTIYNGLEKMIVELDRNNMGEESPYYNWLEA